MDVKTEFFVRCRRNNNVFNNNKRIKFTQKMGPIRDIINKQISLIANTIYKIFEKS